LPHCVRLFSVKFLSRVKKRWHFFVTIFVTMWYLENFCASLSLSLLRNEHNKHKKHCSWRRSVKLLQRQECWQRSTESTRLRKGGRGKEEEERWTSKKPRCRCIDRYKSARFYLIRSHIDFLTRRPVRVCTHAHVTVQLMRFHPHRSLRAQKCSYSPSPSDVCPLSRSPHIPAPLLPLVCAHII